MVEKVWTPLELVRVGADYLKAKQVDEARLAAEMLLAHVMGVERMALYTGFETPVDAEHLDAFRQLIRRRAAREPTQYILGRAEFFSLRFAVSPAVLIPRPETGALAELALAHMQGHETPRMAELCAGSSAVAIAAVVNHPGLRAWATDISEDALAMARANAETHGVAERVTFLRGDLAEPLRAAGLTGALDVLVANPPYIGREEYDGLQPEVRRYEPEAALVPPDGRADSFYERLATGAVELLAPGGLAAVEIAPRLAPGVTETLERAGLTSVRIVKDFHGDDRVATGVKKGDKPDG